LHSTAAATCRKRLDQSSSTVIYEAGDGQKIPREYLSLFSLIPSLINATFGGSSSDYRALFFLFIE
jgi:hypothetical protein